jgi:hypothetical protein
MVMFNINTSKKLDEEMTKLIDLCIGKDSDRRHWKIQCYKNIQMSLKNKEKIIWVNVVYAK